MPVECIGDDEENLYTRDGRAERWGQRTGSMRDCGCAEREPARDPSRVRRGAVCAEAGAHTLGKGSKKNLKKSRGFLSVYGSNGWGGDCPHFSDPLHVFDPRQAMIGWVHWPRVPLA